MYLRLPKRVPSGNSLVLESLTAHPLLGAPPDRAAAVRSFRCTNDALAAVARAVGRSVQAHELGQALEVAVHTTVRAARGAAASLDSGARTPEVTAAFEAAFGVSPGYVPTWRPAGQRWDLGAVVKSRFQRAAEILTGGEIRYHCVPEGLHASAPGRYRINLGPVFWLGLTRGELSGVIYVLLSSALRIYFGPALHHGGTGLRRERTGCYVRYALDRMGLPIPPAVWPTCPAAHVAALPSGRSTDSPNPPPERPPRRRVDLFPREVIERIATETPEQRLNRIILETPPGPRPGRSLSGQAGRVFDQALDRLMERARVPPWLRPLARQAVRAAVQSGSDRLLDRALDSLELGDEAREAVKTGVRALWTAPQ